jgi:peptidoglycan/LPS O-acetylase OafA/YrhL
MGDQLGPRLEPSPHHLKLDEDPLNVWRSGAGLRMSPAADLAVRPTSPASSISKPVARIDWLDGVRGCAAFFVMMHHIYLGQYPEFPATTGPWYLGWLMYGHLSVVVFIVVSGFSLGLAPARSRNKLQGGVSTFFRRRAWRILPPYWAALVLSMAIGHFIITELPGHEVNLRTFVVHSLLLQDIIPNHPPIGAFWSIAIEAQIYLAFPLMLLLSRAYSSKVMSVVVLIFVIIGHWFALHFRPLAPIDHLLPQFWAGFAFGVMAADEVSSPTPHFRRWPLTWVAAGLTAALAALFATIGFVQVHAYFFSVDLMVSLVAAISFVAFVESRSRFVDFLASRPLRFLGQFSFSFYLIHLVVGRLILTWLWPKFDNPVLWYAATLLLVAPPVLVASYIFFLVFERPFLTIRSWSGFRFLLSEGIPILGRNSTKAS